VWRFREIRGGRLNLVYSSGGFKGGGIITWERRRGDWGEIGKELGNIDLWG